MTETIEGGCRCGQIRYRLDLPALPRAYACHCRDCQTWSGSAFSMQFFVPEQVLQISGDINLYERTSPDGQRTSRQRGCAKCMTRVYNTNTARPGLAVIRAGTLDRSDKLTIVAHIWAKRKLAGIDFPAGVRTWPETPPLEDFMAVLRG
jgi:hypothetical protein